MIIDLHFKALGRHRYQIYLRYLQLGKITDGTSVTSCLVMQPEEFGVPFAGGALQVSAEAFTSDPCSLPRRQAVVPAARSLLAAVTRLLVLADVLDVTHLLQHLSMVSNICSPWVSSGLFWHGELSVYWSLADLTHVTPGPSGDSRWDLEMHPKNPSSPMGMHKTQKKSGRFDLI